MTPCFDGCEGLENLLVGVRSAIETVQVAHFAVQVLSVVLASGEPVQFLVEHLFVQSGGHLPGLPQIVLFNFGGSLLLVFVLLHLHQLLLLEIFELLLKHDFASSLIRLHVEVQLLFLYLVESAYLLVVERHCPGWRHIVTET